jgi:hypothetical protein
MVTAFPTDDDDTFGTYDDYSDDYTEFDSDGRPWDNTPY